MSCWIVRVDLYTALEISLSVRKIPIETLSNIRPRSISFGKLVVYFQCLCRRYPSLGIGFLSRRRGVTSKDDVRICKSGICQGVVWIFLYSLIEILNAFINSVARSLIPKVSAFQIKLISFGIICGTSRQLLFFLTCYPQPQLFGYFPCDLFLH